MNDLEKTKEQLVAELAEMRQRIAELESTQNGVSETNSHLAPTHPWWHSVTANTPVLILILDRDHRVRFINHTDSGGNPDEVIGMTPYDFCQPEGHDTIRECLDRVLKTGEPGMYESLARRLDGQQQWYESHVGPIVEDGKVVALSVVVINATARKQVEQERDQTHAILNAAIECLPFHFFAIGPDGRYMLVNAVTRNQYRDAIGRTPEEVCPNERDLSLWLENNRRAFAGERVEGETELTVQGEKRHYFNIVTPIRDDKEFYGILGVNVDITERVKAEAALKRSCDDLDLRVKERTAELESANEQLKQEIQRRQQVEESLRKSEQQYRTLVEASPDAVVMSDLTGQVIFACPRAVELLGFDSSEELCARRTKDLIVEEERQQLAANLSNLAEVGVRRGTEYTGIRKDGSQFPVEVSSAVIRDATGAPKAVMAVVRDITARKRSQEALQESEEQYRTLVEACPDGVVMTDLGGRVVFASRQAVELYGGDSAEELCGLEATSFMVHEERQRAKESITSLVHEGVHRNLEYTFLRRDGRRIPGELSSAVVRDATGRPQALMAVARDITERKRAQEALQRERRTLLHMLGASDRERQVIAYDIHDGLAQQLAAAIMQFQTYEHFKDHAASKAKTAYDAGVEMVQQAHSEARRLVSGVRPPALDEAGVAVAISHLVHEQREPKEPQIEYHDDVEFDRLPPILENAIYRIAQEAVTNACQHSESPKVRVSLVQEGDQIRLEVQDWGVGFDPESVDENRFGLEGIKERTRLLGGELSIESEPGKGTCIRVVLPILERE